MTGTLTVTTAGTPVPPPRIEVELISTKLAKVVTKEKLEVSIEALAPTPADGVADARFSERRLAGRAASPSPPDRESR